VYEAIRGFSFNYRAADRGDVAKKVYFAAKGFVLSSSANAIMSFDVRSALRQFKRQASMQLQGDGGPNFSFPITHPPFFTFAFMI
jgi:hypothetical protein